MSSDLLNGGSVLAVIAEKSQDEVLEWLRQALSTGLFPVSGVVALKQKIVEVLVLFGLLEREDALHDDEKDDACGEQVDLGAIVGLAFLNLWSHVGHGSSVRLEIVDFPEGGKAEISNFKVHGFVDKDVFKFQISVDDTFSVHVLEYVAHLRQKETATVFTHTSEGLAKIKEQTSSNELEENVDKVADFSARWLNNSAVRAITNNLDDIWVLKSLKDLDFLLNGLDRVGISLQELLTKKLESDTFGWVVNFTGQIHFRSVSLAERLENVILSVENWVLTSFSVHLVNDFGLLLF